MNSGTDLKRFASGLRALMCRWPAIDPNEADHLFNRLALELFAFQFSLNHPYRQICAAKRASPGEIQTWSEIPSIPTAGFKELDLSCIPAEIRTTVFHSSGTTQPSPSRHFHNAESLAVYEESLLHWFGPHFLGHGVFNGSIGPGASSSSPTVCTGTGGGDDDVPAPICSPMGVCDKLAGSRGGHRPPRTDCQLVILTPPPNQAPHSSLVHMFDAIRRQLGVDESVFVGQLDNEGAWELNLKAVLEVCGISCKRNSLESGGARLSRPLWLLGTAFSLVHLLDWMANHNLRVILPSGSRVLETGGYKGRTRALPKCELYSLIETRLGIPENHIISEYGMSELSSQAYDGRIESSPVPHRAQPRIRVFRFPPWARAQIVSPETSRQVSDGETGLLRIFDLANVFSVMAIQTEDLAVRCGDGFELIGRATHSEPRGCSLMTAHEPAELLHR